MIMSLPRNWRNMSEKQKDAFINWGATLHDRQRELERRTHIW